MPPPLTDCVSVTVSFFMNVVVCNAMIVSPRSSFWHHLVESGFQLVDDRFQSVEFLLSLGKAQKKPTFPSGFIFYRPLSCMSTHVSHFFKKLIFMTLRNWNLTTIFHFYITTISLHILLHFREIDKLRIVHSQELAVFQ